MFLEEQSEYRVLQMVRVQTERVLGSRHVLETRFSYCSLSKANGFRIARHLTQRFIRP
jgi:hypothetical protein